MLRRLLALVLLLIAAPAAAETIVVHAGHLIADAAHPAAGPSTITIVDGRIQSVAPGLQPPPAGARLIDLSSRTVLPGLIDAHVHFMSRPGAAFWRDAVDSDDYLALIGARNALVTLRAGFTTVRDLGSPGTAGFALRRAIDEGVVPGPRMLVSGNAALDHRRPWRRRRLPPRGDRGARRPQHLHRRPSNARLASASSPAPAPT